MEETQIMGRNKMGEPIGVSVSFGKFENDALSWEKWSSFSPNKYLEEVGKCSTPGSVAQKKAFFEAHYKKIAAMKAEAELLDQQTDRLGDHGVEEIDEEHNDCSEIKVCLHEEEGTEVTEPEISVAGGSVTLEEEGKPVDDDEDLVPSESPIVLTRNVDKLEEAVLVNDESMKLVKQHFHVDLETETKTGIETETETPQESKQEATKPKAENVARKVNPSKVEKSSLGMKKKEASFIPKSPVTSTAKSAKPNTTPLLKKANASLSSSLSKNKNHSVSESRRVTPMSLHLSMSMNSVNSDTASSVTSSRRRSLFMEQMGDKDIVKRAFKTFQNRVNQLPSPANGSKQLPAKRSGQKASNSMAYQKENERSRKTIEKVYPARGQLGPTWKSVSSGSFRGSGVDERRSKTGPTSVISKSNERADRHKEFLKDLEEKSNARVAEKSQLSSKSKEVKDVEIKKLGFKAKPMPSFYRPQGVSKTTSEKEASRTGNPRQR